MTGYPYIIDLFTAVLSSSKAIGGRFHVSNLYGAQEINSDNLGNIVDGIPAAIDKKKYPLSMIAPPHSYFKPSDQKGEWERFNIVQFFVTSTFYNEKGIVNQNLKTATSNHKVEWDWHDMKRVAFNFMRALHNLQRTTRPSLFRLPSTNSILCIPVSNVGVDRVSGVRIHYDIEIFVGCEKEDYEEYPVNLTVNLDSHAEHNI